MILSCHISPKGDDYYNPHVGAERAQPPQEQFHCEQALAFILKYSIIYIH